MVCIKNLNEALEVVKSVFTADHERFQYIDNNKSYLRMRFIVNDEQSFTFRVSLPFEYPKVKPIWFVQNPIREVLVILRDLAEVKKTDDMTLFKQVDILLKDLGDLFKMDVDKYIGQLDAVIITEDIKALAVQACDCSTCLKECMLLGACGTSTDNDDDKMIVDSIDGAIVQIENPSKGPNFKKEGANNRLMHELREFYRSDSYAKGFFDIDLVQDSLYEWKVDLFCIDNTSMLASDLLSLKREGHDGFIKLHMHFSQKYPYEPPFVRIVYPHITGGFVMGGGVFCTELLSAKGWRSVYSVESVLVQIGAALGNANARTSKNAVELAKKEYTLERARNSYKSIESYHERMGWRNRNERS